MNGTIDPPFHLLGFYTASLASAASNTALGSMTDQAWTFDATGYFMPDNYRLWMAYAGNDALNALRINQPSLQVPFYPYIDPVSLTLLPANVPPLYKAFEFGLELRRNEYLRMEASRDVVAASACAALAWIGKQRKTPSPGPRRTLRFTSAITIAAGTWALGTFTPATTLPDGEYEIVGLNMYGTNLLAARIAFTTGGMRPGVICQGAQGEWNQPAIDRNELGSFGSFINTVLPNIELFGAGAGSAQIGYLDLVKIR